MREVIQRGAVISECEKYRYMLYRYFVEEPKNTIAFIGLNPSTADATVNDNTIRRLIDYADRWGYDGLNMYNLYAFRATDPKDMLASSDPVGPLNDEMLVEAATYNNTVVACWGVNAKEDRESFVIGLMKACDIDLMCIALSKHGKPRHPLYLKKDLTPQMFFKRG
jgi:hypothetical protein